MAWVSQDGSDSDLLNDDSDDLSEDLEDEEENEEEDLSPRLTSDPFLNSINYRRLRKMITPFSSTESIPAETTPPREFKGMSEKNFPPQNSGSNVNIDSDSKKITQKSSPKKIFKKGKTIWKKEDKETGRDLMSLGNENVPSQLYPKENLFSSIQRVSLRWSYPGLKRHVQEGTLYVTLYRLFFQSYGQKRITRSHLKSLNTVSIPYLDVIRMNKKSIEHNQVQLTIQCSDFKYMKLAFDEGSSDLVLNVLQLYTNLKSVNDLFAFSYSFRPNSTMVPYTNSQRGVVKGRRADAVMIIDRQSIEKPPLLLGGRNRAMTAVETDRAKSRKYPGSLTKLRIGRAPGTPGGGSLSTMPPKGEGGTDPEGPASLPNSCVISELSSPSRSLASVSKSSHNRRAAGAWRAVQPRTQILVESLPAPESLSPDPRTPSSQKKRHRRSISVTSIISLSCDSRRRSSEGSSDEEEIQGNVRRRKYSFDSDSEESFRISSFTSSTDSSNRSSLTSPSSFSSVSSIKSEKPFFAQKKRPDQQTRTHTPPLAKSQYERPSSSCSTKESTLGGKAGPPPPRPERKDLETKNIAISPQRRKLASPLGFARADQQTSTQQLQQSSSPKEGSLQKRADIQDKVERLRRSTSTDLNKMRGSRCGGRDQSQKQQDQSNSSPSFSPSPPSLSPPSSPSLTDGWTLYDPLVEFERMGIFLMNNYTDPFRLTKVNTEYQKSPTYPRYLCVPATVEDATLDQVFKFRSKGRIPVVCWKRKDKPVSISRCSQPFVGVKGSRCQQDEELINAIRTSSYKVGVPAAQQELKIVDARPKAAAIGNKAMGAGYEFGGRYENCGLEFMGIENIHEIRKSFNSLQNLVRKRYTTESWYTALESTSWHAHLRTILRAAVYIVDLIEKGKPVMVHCSDGWDRTAQLVALAELMLDPYYRTIVGFEVLLEKEWLSYGHKFAQRYGHQEGQKFSSSERSPIFLQFIDCVWQLVRQFPRSFQFNEAFLITILDNVSNCRFGTFLCNCVRERELHRLSSRTVSLWTEMNSFMSHFINPNFVHYSKILHASVSASDFQLWETYYFRWNSSTRPEYTIQMMMEDFSQGSFSQGSNRSRGGDAKSPPPSQPSKQVAQKPFTSTNKSDSAPKVHCAPRFSRNDTAPDASNSFDQSRASRGSGGITQPEPPKRPPFFKTRSSDNSRVSKRSSNHQHYGIFKHNLRDDAEPPRWVPDRWAEACSDCRRVFNHLRRRHHCRACGKVFCGRCAREKIELPEYKIFTPKRVCMACFNERSHGF